MHGIDDVIARAEIAQDMFRNIGKHEAARLGL